MTQFVAMMWQGCVIAFTSDCLFPRTLAKAYVVYIATLFMLFLQFALGKYLFGGQKKVATGSKGSKGKIAVENGAKGKGKGKRGGKEDKKDN